MAKHGKWSQSLNWLPAISKVAVGPVGILTLPKDHCRHGKDNCRQWAATPRSLPMPLPSQDHLRQAKLTWKSERSCTASAINWLPSCPGDEAKTLWALIQDLWGCQTTSVHHSYADTSPAIADSKFGKESDQDTGDIKVEMANGQRLSGAEEESNATAEAMDFTDNEDLPSARQFLLKVPFGLYILLVQWKVTIVT